MSDFSYTITISCPQCASRIVIAPDDGAWCGVCGWDDGGCKACNESEFDGCIDHSPCCGAHILPGSDCCSDCKEHTCVENI
jgi:hypothetical protein